ncbi:MAG: hypothetical protein ACR2OC_06790 [Solirubrobacterales bacterium]
MFAVNGRVRNFKVLALLVVSALAGGTLAAVVAFGQGAGNYQPSTTTVTTTTTTTTTTTPSVCDDTVSFRATGTGARKLGKFVQIEVDSDEDAFVHGRGRLSATKIPGRKSGSRETLVNKTTRRYRLGEDAKGIPGGTSAQLDLSVPKKLRKAIRRSKKYGGRVRAKVTVSAVDACNNTGKIRLRLNFRDFE